MPVAASKPRSLVLQFPSDAGFGSYFKFSVACEHREEPWTPSEPGLLVSSSVLTTSSSDRQDSPA